MADEKDPCWLKPPCMSEYGCRPLNKPLDHDMLSPFVLLRLGEEGNLITVGNESYPNRPNTAVIKSMEWGYINEGNCVFEIIDEAGGELDVFVRNIQENGCLNFSAGTDVNFKFGWLRADCGVSSDQGMLTFGNWIKTMIVQIDVSYAGGLTKYTITCNSIASNTDLSRENKIEGEGGTVIGKGMRLVDAVARICATNGITPVWAMHDAQGKVLESTLDVPDEWEWNVGGKDGPRGNWHGDNKDPLSVISTWLEPYRVKHGAYGAGITLHMDSMDPRRLYLWKDPRIEKINCPDSNDPRYFGTFVVNGARCSPVIKFDPKFNFLAVKAGKNVGGTASGGQNSASQRTDQAEDKKSPNCKEEDKKAGLQLEVAVTDNAKVNYSPREVHIESLRSLAAHAKANLKNEFMIGPIQGDLVLMGMPYDKYVDQKMFAGSRASIVVLNPFHLAGDMNSGCGDWSWLASSGCNVLLSDRDYFITGINHSIREGSYTTTLKVTSVNPVKTRSPAD
jgi:hypothetical protein